MKDLTVTNLVTNTEDERINSFEKNIDSNLNIDLDYTKDSDEEWLTIFEDTLPNIDTILRNPNRFIINEEEVVKIEQARRVTVESIKHLSQNTNLIQDIDKKTGDVKPSKILNVNKEESFETYENKFIYSLIQNMRNFIALKKKNIMAIQDTKNVKALNYNGVSQVGKEKVDVSVKINSHLEKKGNNGDKILERILKIEERMADLTYLQTYKDIERTHSSLVVSPIKKTNVILKNSNFQKAVILWNYIQEHVSDHDSNQKIKMNYNDNGEAKKYFDETFLLHYLISNNLNNDEDKELDKEEVTNNVAENMVQKMLDINDQLTEEQIKEIVAAQYTKIKYRSVTNDNKIREIFIDKMNKFIEQINQLEY